MILSHPGEIEFVLDTDRPSERVAFELQAVDVPLLRAYLAEALVLEGLVRSFGPRSIGFSMSAQIGGPATLTSREPDPLQRAALLHHLRPFVLDDEPFSFFRSRNVVANSAKSAFLAERLKELKRMFGGQRLGEQITVLSGAILVSSEATLRKWLNAFEYHRDRDKAEELERTLAALPAGITRPVFFMLLFQKVDAVLHLAHIVSKMMNAIDTPAAGTV